MGPLSTEAERQRRESARAVLGALRHRDFRNTLDLVNAEGDHAVVAAAWDDPVGMIFERSRKLGEPAYVALLNDQNELEFISIHSDDDPTITVSDDDECPINKATPVGMLMLLLKTTRRPVRCRELPEEVTFELVDDSGPCITPA